MGSTLFSSRSSDSFLVKRPESKSWSSSSKQTKLANCTRIQWLPSRVEDDIEKLQDGNLKNEMIVHAEQNALLCSGSRARGGTLYVYGKPVCPRCAVVIIQAGIKRVAGIKPDPVNNPDSDTHKSGQISLKMFREADVLFSALDPKILSIKKPVGTIKLSKK
jgi:deoxycytidylate deaminase